jgi:hypothetical protein
MLRQDYFTSFCGAQICFDHIQLRRIEDWFHEIAIGIPERAELFKRTAGYFFTMQTHDRKFYVLKGNGKNGKGLFKHFFENILQTRLPHRMKNVDPSFWINPIAQAERPSPNVMALEGASLAYTDDMTDRPLDVSRLKSFTSHENSVGRAMYGRHSRIVTLKCKVLWTTNVTPNLHGDDKALWDRYVQLPFEACYIERDQVPDPARFRFLQDTTVYDHLLTLTDAFFTLSLQALSAFYAPFIGPRATRPSVLGPMPLPESIKQLQRKERMAKSAVQRFFGEHVDRAPDEKVDPFDFVSGRDMFNAYMQYLDATNDQHWKKNTTETSFLNNVAVSLDIRVEDGRVYGCRLHNRNVRPRVEGEPHNFPIVIYHDSFISAPDPVPHVLPPVFP